LALVSPDRVIVPDGRVCAPCDVVNGFLLLDVRVGEGGPHKFILDTAATGVILDTRIAAGHPISHRNWPFTSPGRRATRNLRHISLLSIAGAQFRDIHVLESDLAPVRETVGAPVDGILGIGLFRGVKLTIDYSHASLRIATSKENEDASNKARLALRRLPSGVLTVPVRINNGVAWCKIDTASAGGLVVPEMLALRLPLDPPLYQSPVRQIMTFLGPIPIRVSRLSADAIIGETTVSQPVVWIQPGGALIGSQILQRCIVVIDQPAMAAYFKPVNCAPDRE
jgi:hypothetical protein